MSEPLKQKWDRIYTKNVTQRHPYDPIQGLARWLVYKYTAFHGGLPRSVVEIGCGHGHLSFCFAEILTLVGVTGLDISSVMIDRLSQQDRVRFLQCDVRDGLPVAPTDILVTRVLSLLNGRDNEVPDIKALIASWAHHLTISGMLFVLDITDFTGTVHERGWYCRTWEEMRGLYSDIEGLTTLSIETFPDPYGVLVGICATFMRAT